MKFNFRPISALLFTIGSAVGAAGQAETLSEIYQMAIANDHQFKAAEARYQAGKESKVLGRSALHPQISAAASWQDSETESDGQTINSSEGGGYQISITQNLINLSAWHDFKSGNYAAKVAAAEFIGAEQALILRAATAYFDVLEAYEALETAKAEERALKQQLDQTQKRFEVGLIAITEVHEAQAAFDSAVASRINAEGFLGIAFEALEVITGQPIAALSPLKEDFPVAFPEPANREEWVAFSLENNVSLRAAKLTEKSSKSTAKARRADIYPSLTGSYSYSESDTTTNQNNGFGNNSNDIDTQTLSVTLNIPIYAGGRLAATHRRAKQQYYEASENRKQTKRDVTQSARSTHLAVVTGVATVKARAQAITSNQSALDATQSGYEVGTRDLVDVLNAQRNLFRAQRDYQEALYDYILNTLNLKQIAGTLNGEDIVELNKWLNAQENVTYSF